MPLYKGKTTIQALGGHRIEWKAQFRVEELGKMLVTAPPCNMRVGWDGPAPSLPNRWAIQIDAPGPLVLEGYDIGFQDTEPPLVRGFVAVSWNEATSTASLIRRNWGGGGTPDVYRSLLHNIVRDPNPPGAQRVRRVQKKQVSV